MIEIHKGKMTREELVREVSTPLSITCELNEWVSKAIVELKKINQFVLADQCRRYYGIRKLTEKQKSLYTNSHDVWYRQNEKDSTKYSKAFAYLIAFIKGDEDVFVGFNDEERDDIIRLTDYLLFHFSEFLEHPSIEEILTDLDTLENTGAMSPVERDIYEICMYRKRIREHFKGKNTPPEEIDSVLYGPISSAEEAKLVYNAVVNSDAKTYTEAMLAIKEAERQARI